MGQGKGIALPATRTVKFPTFEVKPTEPISEEEEMLREVLEEPLQKPWMDAAIQKARQQIMAAEDQALFDTLDAIAAGGNDNAIAASGLSHAACSHRGHKAYLRPIGECLEPECVARHVVEE